MAVSQMLPNCRFQIYCMLACLFACLLIYFPFIANRSYICRLSIANRSPQIPCSQIYRSRIHCLSVANGSLRFYRSWIGQSHIYCQPHAHTSPAPLPLVPQEVPPGLLGDQG
jgi:hypothetical protein